MPTNGTLNLEQGYVSAIVPAGGYIDAGRADEISGIEFAVESLHVNVGPNANERHADLMVTLSMHPATAEQIMLAIAVKISGAPAFNEREWLTIAGALRDQFAIVATERDAHAANELHKIASAIERAYHPEAAA